MSHLSPIWSVLLISGIFLVDTCAKASSTAEPTVLLNTTTQAPPNTTTTHAPSNTTTHAPSNTTTHALSNTTTHAPSNTTTHAPSNTTTHAPSNTTTHVPSNTTTHVPSNTTAHTTAKPSPTLAPGPSPPENGNYTVKNKTVTCIVAQMGLELELENSTKKKNYFNIEPKHTTANGTCGDKKANLLLTFSEGTIYFVFVKESKVYYINEVTVNFSLASAGHWNGTASKLKLLSTDEGYSVKCKNTPTVKLANNMQLVMSNVKLQAFDIKNGDFGKEEMCTFDRNIVAVAIAVTVIIVIIIAIVIYFIWHKRRSSGYQHI
ncbi:lysosome-associated membrane glycoprotein 3 isoform X2 [Pseudophryne corroboree]|uniref:lysosome-associated membrane glycoprotein 3 isoform X2 n=1 Tax=Pseudophryne corroboree TaxID=495146 RepID=UPI003081C6F0